MGIYTSDVFEKEALLLSYIPSDETVILYNSLEELKQAVTVGDIRCGFFVNISVQDYINSKRPQNKIEVYIASGYLYAEVDKEEFFDAWLKCCSDAFISYQSDKIFDSSQNEIVEKLISRKDYYLNGDDLFNINLVYMENDNKETAEKKVYSPNPVKSAVAICIFIYIFMIYGHIYSGNPAALISCLPLKSKKLYKFVYLLAYSTLPAILGVFCLTVFSEIGFIKSLTSIIIYLAVCIFWIYIIQMLIKKETTYIALAPVCLIIQIIICPLIVDLSEYFRIFSIVKYFLPMGYI